MNPVEAVAQAICGVTSAGQMFPWEELNEADKDAWRRIAAAAIGALELREEWAVVTEEYGFSDETPDDYADSQQHAEKIAAECCQSCESCRNALPKHVVRRLVSAWQPIGEERT